MNGEPAPVSPATTPAVAAAQRTERRRNAPRPYEQPAEPGLMGEGVVLAATRALVSARSRDEAAEILQTALRDLGAAVIPARLAEALPDTLPADVSLGVGEPLLVVVPKLSVAALHIDQHLSPLLHDATLAAERSDVVQRQSELASVDPLTGVASRRLISTTLARARQGDVVCMLDLDGFKELNDTQGHAAGDRALQEFGDLLRTSVRAGEFCGRYGGDEFLVVFSAAPVAAARQRMARLMREWRGRTWHGTSASAGLAVVGPGGGGLAGQAADAALLAAKRAGRDRVAVAP